MRSEDRNHRLLLQDIALPMQELPKAAIFALQGFGRND